MLHSIRQFIEALQDPYGLTPHTGRNRSVPFFGRRTPALGRQQRGGFQNPLRRPVQNAQMLHTAYGASRSDLSRETPAARAFTLAGPTGRASGARGHRRWIEGITLYEAVMRGAGSGDKAHLSNLARQFDRLALELLESDWAHGDLKPENILLDESGTLRPVDFDAMRCFFPLRRREKSRTGHGTYQHPGRTAEAFGRVDRLTTPSPRSPRPARAWRSSPDCSPATTGERDCCSRSGKSSGTAVRPTQNASHCSKRRAMPSAIASPGCSNPR